MNDQTFDETPIDNPSCDEDLFDTWCVGALSCICGKLCNVLSRGNAPESVSSAQSRTSTIVTYLGATLSLHVYGHFIWPVLLVLAYYTLLRNHFVVQIHLL